MPKNKKQIRESFRQSVFKRDNFTCKVCNTKRSIDELDSHHITDRNEMPNGGYVKENGVTVCIKIVILRLKCFTYQMVKNGKKAYTLTIYIK